MLRPHPSPRFVVSDIPAPLEGCPACVYARNTPIASVHEPSTDTLQGLYLCSCGHLWTCSWSYSSTRADREGRSV